MGLIDKIKEMLKGTEVEATPDKNICQEIDVVRQKLLDVQGQGDQEILEPYIKEITAINNNLRTSPAKNENAKLMDQEVIKCLGVMLRCIDDKDIQTLSYCMECIRKASELRPAANKHDVEIIHIYVERTRVSLDYVSHIKSKSHYEATMEEVIKDHQALTEKIRKLQATKDITELSVEFAKLSEYKSLINKIQSNIEQEEIRLLGSKSLLIRLKTQVDGAGDSLTQQELTEIGNLIENLETESTVAYEEIVNEYSKIRGTSTAIDKRKAEINEKFFSETIDPSLYKIVEPVADTVLNSDQAKAPIKAEEKKDEADMQLA